jgi:hypothetical protein
MEGVQSQASGRVAAVRPYLPEPVSGPTWWGSALKIGGSAFNAARPYITKQPPGDETGGIARARAKPVRVSSLRIYE